MTQGSSYTDSGEAHECYHPPGISGDISLSIPAIRIPRQFGGRTTRAPTLIIPDRASGMARLSAVISDPQFFLATNAPPSCGIFQRLLFIFLSLGLPVAISDVKTGSKNFFMRFGLLQLRPSACRKSCSQSLESTPQGWSLCRAPSRVQPSRTWF